MPMAIGKIYSFENFELVKVNVFDIIKNSCCLLEYPIKETIWSPEVLLISVGQRYHYVLIKNLKNG